MLGRMASRRARFREIFAHQEGVHVRHISPPDYTEEDAHASDPPTYNQSVGESSIFEGTTGNEPSQSPPILENSQPGLLLISSESSNTRNSVNENQAATFPGGGEGGGNMANDGDGGDTPVVSSGRRLLDLQERIEAMRKRNANFTCFFCCHVRTGTIVIGFWHMLLHLMALSLIAIVIIHPELLMANNNASSGSAFDSEDKLMIGPADRQDVQAVNCGGETPCILAAQGDGGIQQSATDLSLSLGNLLTTHRLNTDEINVALFITLCTFVVTLLLVYGAFRGQPSHLMPFFFLQVFDFCISSMTMIGYLSYLPNIRQLIRDTPAFPFQQQLLEMNTKCLTFFVMVIFISTLMAKGYCISIVWRCYKFLMLKAQAGQSVLRYLGSVSGPVDQESQTLVVGQDVPDYDTVMADPQYRKKLLSLYPEPPPSYDAAMAALVSHQERERRNNDVAAAEAGTMDVAGAACPSYEQSTSGEGQAGAAPADTTTDVDLNITVSSTATVTPSSHSNSHQ
ncbi:Lysosomal-associated transmembrane protein 4A [Halocaridina rubra]|uniref:Lysosomal-associated transmembrane protein 4A n=1 Tax=Halocaridina rubra TaxID=373956 RepID=A0AAN8XID5_HALRR